VLLATFSFGYPSWELRKLNEEKALLDAKIHPLKVEMRRWQLTERAALDELHRRGLPLLAEGFDHQLKQKLGIHLKADPAAINKAAEEHERITARAKEERIRLEQEAVGLENKEIEWHSKRIAASQVGLVSIAGQIVGCLLIVTGGYFWLRRTQHPQDAILQAEVPGATASPRAVEPYNRTAKIGLALATLGLALGASLWVASQFVRRITDELESDARSQLLALVRDLETLLMSKRLMDEPFDRLAETSGGDAGDGDQKRLAMLDRLQKAYPEFVPLHQRLVQNIEKYGELENWRARRDLCNRWEALSFTLVGALVAIGFGMRFWAKSRPAGSHEFERGEGI
jgi:hypothetical protein